MRPDTRVPELLLRTKSSLTGDLRGSLFFVSDANDSNCRFRDCGVACRRAQRLSNRTQRRIHAKKQNRLDQHGHFKLIMLSPRRSAPLRWPSSRGTTGRFATEQVAGFVWNGWPESVEYASNSRGLVQGPPYMRLAIARMILWTCRLREICKTF